MNKFELQPKSSVALSGAKAETPNAPTKARRAIRMARILFITGPRMMFTARLSKKTAALMMALSTPSIFCLALFTIPAFLFHRPEHQAYFQFANLLELDPMRWLAVILAAICAIISIGLPALSQQNSFTAAAG
jgi:hypothetical protein